MVFECDCRSLPSPVRPERRPLGPKSKGLHKHFDFARYASVVYPEPVEGLGANGFFVVRAQRGRSAGCHSFGVCDRSASLLALKYRQQLQVMPQPSPSALSPQPSALGSTPLRIATRQSALALWQARHVEARLRMAHPGLAIELIPLSTRGDLILDRPLAEIGGKGLFLKELEVAMLDGRADIAVHSLKDVPMELDAGFALGAVLERADAADAFVSNQFERIDQLPQRARVGTSSLRRQAQLRALRPDLTVLDLRGNVGTRLNKLDAGDYDAIILACAGLDRLGEASRIRSRLEPPKWLPAAAQGAIAIEYRDGDARVAALLAPLDDADTTRCVTAERALTRHLQGSCQVPIAAYCIDIERGLHLAGLVGDASSGRLLRAEASGAAEAPDTLGREVAELLLAQGAGELLGRAV